MVGAEFGQVVDHARTDGHGNGIGRSQHTVQLLDERPFGVEFRIGEHVRFVLPDPRIGEGPAQRGDPLVGELDRREVFGAEGFDVGDHDGAAADTNSLNISAVRGRVPTPITSALVSVVR